MRLLRHTTTGFKKKAVLISTSNSAKNYDVKDNFNKTLSSSLNKKRNWNVTTVAYKHILTFQQLGSTGHGNGKSWSWHKFVKTT